MNEARSTRKKSGGGQLVPARSTPQMDARTRNPKWTDNQAVTPDGSKMPPITVMTGASKVPGITARPWHCFDPQNS